MVLRGENEGKVWKNKSEEEKKSQKLLQGMLDKWLYFPSGKGLHDNPLGCRLVICHNIEKERIFRIIIYYNF